MAKPYNFIPFLKTIKNYSKDSNDNLSGRIEIEIKAINPIHIAQDDYEIDNNENLYKPFFKIGESYAIPGTSVKGMIRSLAEMVSHSCITIDKREIDSMPKEKLNRCKIGVKSNSYNKDSRNKNSYCIICDLFGAMGKASKIKVSNFIYENGTGANTVLGLPILRSPHKNEGSLYKQNKIFRGYKIYNHGIESVLKTGNYNVEVFKNGAKFKGHLLYEDLTEEELNLLCYSLGLLNDFNHKIGYGKPAYYGSIEVSVNDEKYIKCAENYKLKADKSIKDNIELLEKIYSYKNAVKQPDYEGTQY